jgi:hypothetical protein
VEEFLKIALAIIAGALLTSWGYNFAFSSRLTRMETNIINITTQVNKPFVVPSEITKQLTELCSKQADLERRVEHIEEKRSQS